MATNLKIWFDKEGDFLEVLFSDKPGYMQETENDAIMTRVDLQGNVLGFSILGVSQLQKDNPLIAEISVNVAA
ncbi:MAG: DUF2283 domain-containing protein [Snowella sp.]|jgi:hypothetical protein|nr:MAG: DUF2283 domain-containing protein [Snowella sp.]